MEFIDLKAQYRALQPEIDGNISRILSGAHFIGGEEVSQLEEKLAAYVGRKHCVTCGNGTDALQLAYMAYGIGPGDAVFCDIEPDTYNLCPASLETHIQAVLKDGRLRPRAVVAVDFLGNPARFDEISAICERYGLLLIEDAAQGTSAAYHGKKCGSLGDISTTSFFPSKPLGCYGDGGAVFTDSDEIAELLRSYKVHGKGPKGKYDNVRIGLNSRLDTLQAGVLLPKLAVLERELAKRQEVAARYDAAFAGKLQTPVITEGSISSFAQYCVLAEDEAQRTRVLDAMKAANVPSLIYYPTPLHVLDAFAPYPEEELPNAARYARCNFGLPFSPYLTEEDQETVIRTVLAAL